MAYCLIADIQAKIQYTVFSATTNPTDTQVTAFCDDITQDMDEKFQTVGIAVPITDADKLKLLKRIACFGVLAEFYRSVDEMTEKAKMYQDLYDKAIKNILNNPDILSATSEVTNNPTWTGEERDESDTAMDEDFNRHGDDW
jgi:hypothetical protein